MIQTGVITGKRITHRSAGVDEIAAGSPESQRAGVAQLLTAPAVEEAFVISTCNRTEAYVVTADGRDGHTALEAFFHGIDEEAVITTGHEESLRHLLRVATGLESAVLGEDQIIGQVRTAYEDARTAGGIGQWLEAAITKAIHVGERARTETSINEGIVSLGSAATRLVARNVDVETETALVIGAGEMGQLAARSLADAGVDSVVVANRTVPHAEHVVDELAIDGDAIGLDGLSSAAAAAGIIVAATGSPEPLLEPADLGGREQIVVDLGQPRDVDPQARILEPVTLYDLDDLETVTQQTQSKRLDAAREVEAIVEAELANVNEQFKRARADEVIASMYESAERLKARELETAWSRLEAGDGEAFTDEQRRIVESMVDSLVNQLLAAPTKSLREAAGNDDWETINTALHLFDPAFGTDREDSPSPPEVESPLDGHSVGITDDD